MADQDSKSPTERCSDNSFNSGRRGVIAGIGAVAASSWLPAASNAQDTTRESEFLIIGGGIANFTNVASTFKGIVHALKDYQAKLIEHSVSVYDGTRAAVGRYERHAAGAR